MRTSLAVILLLGFATAVLAGDRPHILWITSEDNAAHWLGCYGNSQAKTPRLDAVARDGILFEHAYANAPVCAVARCTLLHGVYAVTLGTQHMRSRHAIPASFRPYVSYLREAGYYCTNNAKTDYNFRGNDRSIWDACSGKAHYRNRPEDAPFFAVFNLTVSHESSLFPAKARKNRSRQIIPVTTRLDLSTVSVPPHLPDLPEVRSDVAIYHDVMSALDRQVGRILDELAANGLADDTIVCYYSDHGGPTPRGKRYLADTGVRVPLIVHIPEKWRDLSRFAAGSRVEELVSFVDFAPTLLSLCGISTPKQMQGRAFLGDHRSEPAADPCVFLFADRFDEIYGMRRGITDGRFKYIRRFTPHLPAAPYSYYQFGMPSWTAWRDAWQDDQLQGTHKTLWEAPQVVEELYDIRSDPWEVHNLAADSNYAGRLQSMRQRLKQTMRDVIDTGVIPEPMFAELSPSKPIWEFAHGESFDVVGTLDIAWAATSGEAERLPMLLETLESADPVWRYWAAVGCLVLGPEAASADSSLQRLLEDRYAAVRVTAAHALFAAGQRQPGKDAVIRELNQPLGEYAAQLVVNTLTHMEALDDVPDHWVNSILADPQANEYLKRFAGRATKSRERRPPHHRPEH